MGKGSARRPGTGYRAGYDNIDWDREEREKYITFLKRFIEELPTRLTEDPESHAEMTRIIQEALDAEH